MQVIEYVLGRECKNCIAIDNHPHGTEYLSKECEHNKKRVLVIFTSKADAMSYIYDELGMTDKEIMIIPKEELIQTELDDDDYHSKERVERRKEIARLKKELAILDIKTKIHIKGIKNVKTRKKIYLKKRSKNKLLKELTNKEEK